MPPYPDAEALYASLRAVFEHLERAEPQAYQTLVASRLALRLKCSAPPAEVWLDGRQPGRVQTAFGPSRLRPDLDIELTADTLHQILMDTLPMKKAMGSGLVKVRGPAWKLAALWEVIRASRSIYPTVFQAQRRQ